MSTPSSPTRLSGENERFYDANFTAEISQKMRVPKRIKVDGESDEPVVNGPNFHTWHHSEKLEMHVPEKIVVLDEQTGNFHYGHDQHFGTRAMPREVEFENTVMPTDPGMIRVQTPPRVITLDQHYYPTADEYQPSLHPESAQIHRHINNIDNMERRLENFSAGNVSLNDSLQISEGMTTSEEVIHLRKQLAKLNRRVMSIELENMQRSQREKIFCAIGLVYLFFKTMAWLSRSS